MNVKGEKEKKCWCALVNTNVALVFFYVGEKTATYIWSVYTYKQKNWSVVVGELFPYKFADYVGGGWLVTHFLTLDALTFEKKQKERTYNVTVKYVANPTSIMRYGTCICLLPLVYLTKPFSCWITHTHSSTYSSTSAAQELVYLRVLYYDVTWNKVEKKRVYALFRLTACVMCQHSFQLYTTCLKLLYVYAHKYKFVLIM